MAVSTNIFFFSLPISVNLSIPMLPNPVSRSQYFQGSAGLFRCGSHACLSGIPRHHGGKRSAIKRIPFGPSTRWNSCIISPDLDMGRIMDAQNHVNPAVSHGTSLSSHSTVSMFAMPCCFAFLSSSSSIGPDISIAMIFPTMLKLYPGK